MLFNFEEHIFLGKGIVCLAITLPFFSLKMGSKLLIFYHDILNIQKIGCARHPCPPGYSVHFLIHESQALFRAPCVSVDVSKCVDDNKLWKIL